MRHFGLKQLCIKITVIYTFYYFEQWINNKTCTFYRSFKCNILTPKCPIRLISYHTDKHMDVTRIIFLLFRRHFSYFHSGLLVPLLLISLQITLSLKTQNGFDFYNWKKLEEKKWSLIHSILYRCQG